VILIDNSNNYEIIIRLIRIIEKPMFLDNLNLFLRIVEKGGLAAAGRELGISAATVSDRLASLEVYYGASLLIRTTRSISLTDEGRELVNGARRILAEADEVQSRITLGVEKISGTIHISAPIDFGRNRLMALLDAFMVDHPEVRIDLSLTDGNIDLVGQGMDLAFRFGNLADSTLRSKKLGKNRRIVCASPEYLKVYGTPQQPKDLQHHNCLVMRFGTQIDHQWRFMIAGKEETYSVSGNRIANDGSLVREWCLIGHGIALKSEWDIHDDLKSGSLVPLLTDFEPPTNSLQMIYPASAVQPRRVRLLMEWLVQSFSK
jgi:DNA-binding transcriptional LysR family regulator